MVPSAEMSEPNVAAGRTSMMSGRSSPYCSEYCAACATIPSACWNAFPMLNVDSTMNFVGVVDERCVASWICLYRTCPLWSAYGEPTIDWAPNVCVRSWSFSACHSSPAVCTWRSPGRGDCGYGIWSCARFCA